MIDFASFSGFGDAVDNSECWSPVISYVESQYEAFLDAETRVNRVAKMPDSRVHACLYFIAPSGHGLKVKIGNSNLSIPCNSGPATNFIIFCFLFVENHLFGWRANQ